MFNCVDYSYRARLLSALHTGVSSHLSFSRLGLFQAQMILVLQSLHSVFLSYLVRLLGNHYVSMYCFSDEFCNCFQQLVTPRTRFKQLYAFVCPRQLCDDTVFPMMRGIDFLAG